MPKEHANILSKCTTKSSPELPVTKTLSVQLVRGFWKPSMHSIRPLLVQVKWPSSSSLSTQNVAQSSPKKFCSHLSWKESSKTWPWASMLGFFTAGIDADVLLPDSERLTGTLKNVTNWAAFGGSKSSTLTKKVTTPCRNKTMPADTQIMWLLHTDECTSAKWKHSMTRNEKCS